MKIQLLTFLLSLICLSATAQIPQSNKIVYLKDGSNVKGTVTVNDSAGYVMVVDKFKETHYYQKNMIAKIDDEAQHRTGYSLKAKGYLCSIEMGGTDIISRDGGQNIPAFSLNIINSYLLSPIASIGMGLGTEIAGSSTETFMLYGHTRLYFKRSDISPFFDMGFGYTAFFVQGANDYNYYGYAVNSSHLSVTHGMMFNPSLGIRVAVSSKAAFTAGIGYKLYYLHQNADFYYESTFKPNSDYTYYLAHALTFRTGFQF